MNTQVVARGIASLAGRAPPKDGLPVVHEGRSIAKPVEGQRLPGELFRRLLRLALLPHALLHRRVQGQDALLIPEILVRFEPLQPERLEPLIRWPHRALGTGRIAVGPYLWDGNLRVPGQHRLDGILIGDRELVHEVLHLAHEPNRGLRAPHVEQPSAHPIGRILLILGVRAGTVQIVVVNALAGI
eukprot:scaffold37041_cov55-Phaeocystis_antarctica.AAC.5